MHKQYILVIPLLLIGVLAGILFKGPTVGQINADVEKAETPEYVSLSGADRQRLKTLESLVTDLRSRIERIEKGPDNTDPPEDSSSADSLNLQAALSENSAALIAAEDADLRRLIERWPKICEDDKRRILNIAEID